MMAAADDEFSHSVVYTMTGYGGQRLFMLPEADLIAVFTGWNIFETGPLPSEVFFDFILKAVKE